jgi:hypothetical protein
MNQDRLESGHCNYTLQNSDKFPSEGKMIKSAKLELESLLKEKELEEKSYYLRIPLYRVQDKRLRTDCFTSYYDKTYTAQGLPKRRNAQVKQKQ